MTPDSAATEATQAAALAAATQPVLLSVAFPYAPVGPRAVGGAEVILSLIEAELPALGFGSVVVAHADSQPQGRLYPTPIPENVSLDGIRDEVEAAHQANIDRALAENPVALVHMHGLDFHRYRIPPHIPVLVTLHLPPAWYPETVWALPANYHLVCVSETQRATCPAHVRERIGVVGNGVPLPDASTLRPEGRYAVMLARICPEKNLHTGLDAARLAGMPVMLGGEVFAYEAHRRYFTEEILPRLTSSGDVHQGRSAPVDAQPGARFVGGISGEAKARLLARAACLLSPSLAPETSSLVAMEALAAGVPVIAMASGAIPEIVEEGRTGFLIRDQSNAAAYMADAIRRLPELDRRACRSAAETRFGLPRMLDGYAKLYGALALPAPPGSNTLETERLASAVDEAVENDLLEVCPTRIEHITSRARLEALTPDWERLWHRDPRATPFQHPAWLLPWWRQFGPEGELHTLALLETDGTLRGLVPMYTYQPPNGGDPQLLALGAGTTDLYDGIFEATSDPAPMARAALKYMLDKVGDWRSLSLNQIGPHSPLLVAARALGLSIAEAEPCSAISTREALPAKIRANARRYLRRAQQHGALHCAEAETVAEAMLAFEHLVELHRERWHRRREAGVLEDARVLTHHREAIPLLHAAGLLRLFSLTLADNKIAVLYTLADAPDRPERSLYLYLIGIDTRHAELSPGTLLLHAVWQHAQEEGFRKLNLLRGGESYKQLWGAQPEATFALEWRRSAHP